MKMFESNGWTLGRINGSHHVYIKNGHHFSIPGPGNRENSIGLEKTALKKLKEVG